MLGLPLLVLLFHVKLSHSINCELSFRPQLARSTQLPQSYSKSPSNSSNTAQQPVLQSGEIMRFLINCSCCNGTASIAENFSTPGALFYRIFAENRYSTIISRQPNVDPVIRSRFESAGDMSTKYDECRNYPLCAVLYTPVRSNDQAINYPFWVEANLIGRSAIRVELVWINATQRERPDDIPLPSALGEKEIRKLKKSSIDQRHKQFTFRVVEQGRVAGALNATASYVTVFLKPQLFYTIFDWSVFFVAGTIALSAGCSTDPRTFWRQMKRKPLAVAMGLIIHLFITPLIGLVSGYASCLSPEKTYGLFITTALQVGTPGLVVISLSDCHEQFALTLANLANILNLATAPLWVHTVGTYVFKQPILLLRFCGLITLVALVQALGFLLRYARPSVANAVVTWFSRPFLLLAAILFITLGVYINQYVFQAPQQITYLQHVSLALLFMLTTSYACGWLAGLILNLRVQRSRALANQLSVYQGLLAIPLLRICVPSPEGELASATALWTVFLTPVPLVYNAVLTFTIRTIKSAYKAHKVRMQKRGPTAVLCADSLAAVAFTSMLLPETTEHKHKSATTNNEILFDEASNSTINTAPASQRRCKSATVRPTASAVFSLKDSVSDVENRERILEALARKGGVNVSEKKGRKNGGGIPRTPHHHPRSMDDGCSIPSAWGGAISCGGGGGGGGGAAVPLAPPPPSSKPIF
ncbi:sodium-bile acid cotransporter related [Echinococcus granulosus]|uniref:Sodium-bile acid cotransporter related n=1 Tax=Echinococcus granulosus TaxID=6210 RepID=W6UIT9_ECHGR|nr:sodium-bile acid cotransporter related [Echinococcus granulosus]EUB58042.1 sodium-bile acid cotransporter related [Echinococcus granulosus]